MSHKVAFKVNQRNSRFAIGNSPLHLERQKFFFEKNLSMYLIRPGTWLVGVWFVLIQQKPRVPWCGMLQPLEDPELLVKVSPWAEFLKV